jgi:type I restriction enzyme S subunit
VTDLDGWHEVTIADTAEVIVGQSPPGTSYNKEGIGLPFFQGKADFGALHPTPRVFTTAGTKYSEPDDVLISVRAPVGPTNMTVVRSVIGRGLLALRAKATVEPRYLLWAIRAREQELARLGTGSTFSAVRAHDVREFRIPLAPLAEQRRVVDVLEDHLSRLDAAEADVLNARERTTSLKRAAALRALLGESSTQHSRLTREITEDLVLPDLKDRTWARLGELAEVAGGVTKDSKRDDPSMVEVPYLRVANVQRMRLDLATIATIRVPPAKAEALRLRVGDVLLNEGGDRDKLARGWVWEGQIADCIHQNHVYRARPDTTRILPEWAAWSANYLGGEWAARHGRQSVNLASISLSTIRRMPIPLVDLAEQRRLLDTLADVTGGVARLTTQASALMARSATLRRALLTAAFAGRLTGHASDNDRIEELANASDHSR